VRLRRPRRASPAKAVDHTLHVDVLAGARCWSMNADVNAQDDDGMTAMVYAKQNGHTEIVTILLAKGARRNPR